MTSRRTFLALSASAATAAVFPKLILGERLGGAVFSNASTGAYAQGLMTQANFERVVGSEFKVFVEKNGVSYLRLRKVSSPETALVVTAEAAPVVAPGILRAGNIAVKPVKLPSLKKPVQLETFELHLDLLRGPQFEQDSYLVDHGTMGRFAAFVVPGREGVYTATFCNLVQAAKAPVVTPRIGVLAAF